MVIAAACCNWPNVMLLIVRWPGLVWWGWGCRSAWEKTTIRVATQRKWTVTFLIQWNDPWQHLKWFTYYILVKIVVMFDVFMEMLVKELNILLWVLESISYTHPQKLWKYPFSLFQGKITSAATDQYLTDKVLLLLLKRHLFIHCKHTHLSCVLHSVKA